MRAMPRLVDPRWTLPELPSGKPTRHAERKIESEYRFDAIKRRQNHRAASFWRRARVYHGNMESCEVPRGGLADGFCAGQPLAFSAAHVARIALSNRASARETGARGQRASAGCCGRFAQVLADFWSVVFGGVERRKSAHVLGTAWLCARLLCAEPQRRFCVQMYRYLCARTRAMSSIRRLHTQH